MFPLRPETTGTRLRNHFPGVAQRMGPRYPSRQGAQVLVVTIIEVFGTMLCLGPQ